MQSEAGETRFAPFVSFTRQLQEERNYSRSRNTTSPRVRDAESDIFSTHRGYFLDENPKPVKLVIAPSQAIMGGLVAAHTSRVSTTKTKTNARVPNVVEFAI
ncbi:hypothetical protein LXL04_030448 [Taraxacum kok-saghyz]